MRFSKIFFSALLAVSVSFAAGAQGTANELENDFGGRLSVGLDKKIAKGVHVEAEAEVRLSDNFSNLGRYQAGAGLSWKVNDYLKIGGGYLFIQNKNSEGTWKPRHRVYVDATGTLKAGDWRFSLKERLQLTHSDVNNPYQNTPNSLTLKSRVKVAYKGFSAITPYGYIELRNVFNDPSENATWTGSSYSDYSFNGYSCGYLNRVRGSLGAEWKLSKQNALDIFLLGDYCYNKDIDTNAKGTKLKSLTYDRAFNLGLGIGYTFSF